MKKHLKYILPLLFLCIPAILPLLKPGFFESHDGNWMIIRFSAFHQSLVDGHFPVRWSGRLNHGYGYPALNFLYPLPFWLAEFFYIFTNSFVLSIKLVFKKPLLAFIQFGRGLALHIHPISFYGHIYQGIYWRIFRFCLYTPYLFKHQSF